MGTIAMPILLLVIVFLIGLAIILSIKNKSLQNRLLNKSKEIAGLNEKHSNLMGSFNKSMEDRLDLINELNASKKRIAQLEQITETHITIGNGFLPF